MWSAKILVPVSSCRIGVRFRSFRYHYDMPKKLVKVNKCKLDEHIYNGVRTGTYFILFFFIFWSTLLGKIQMEIQFSMKINSPNQWYWQFFGSRISDPNSDPDQDLEQEFFRSKFLDPDPIRIRIRNTGYFYPINNLLQLGTIYSVNPKC